MKYAMVETNDNRVIDVIERDTIPHYPPLSDRTPIVAIECSDSIKIGMYYENGEFIEKESEEPVQLDRMEATQEMILLNQADIIVSQEYTTCLLELQTM